VRIPKQIVDLMRKVTAKRARTVLDHILKHGHVTTEELRDRYGYNHPPRAARDVREQGVPLETFRVVGSDGRRIAAYRLAVTGRRGKRTHEGRRTFSKAFKECLVERDRSRCQVCWTEMEARYLQVDHRVPYDVAGDQASPEGRPQDFMLVCGVCNRAKSWSCEHCGNRQESRRVQVCRSCYWASPRRYSHVAQLVHRRVDLTWVGKDAVQVYEALAEAAAKQSITVPELIQRILRGESAWPPRGHASSDICRAGRTAASPRARAAPAAGDT